MRGVIPAANERARRATASTIAIFAEDKDNLGQWRRAHTAKPRSGFSRPARRHIEITTQSGHAPQKENRGFKECYVLKNT
jgi:hypothetical protein